MAEDSQKIIGIDTRALACAAADAICSSSVPSISYFRRGSFNKLYLLTFDDGPQLVARIPFQKRGVHSKLSSEVATMTFARYHCDIPCPKVFTWNSSETNPVGAPYILMEKACGTPPWVIWYKEPEDRRLKILDNLAMLHARFARPLPFLHLGDIYFAFDMIIGKLDSLSLRDPALYRAGPFSPRPSQGVLPDQQVALLTPSASLIDFWKEYVDHECAAALARWGPVRETIIVAKENDAYPRLQERNYTMGEFLDVASDLQAMLHLYKLPSDRRLLDPCLVTTDYAFRNILIDTTTLEVTSFLDWDDVSLMPFLLCIRFPEDISWSYGAPPDSVWCRTGRFDFVPNEEPPLPGEEYEEEMERLKYGSIYKERLSAYDERFSQKLWKIRGDALKIQYVVTHGWVGYLNRPRWLAATRKEYEACAQSGGRANPERDCCPCLCMAHCTVFL